MIDIIYLSTVVDREAPPAEVVGFSVVGQVVYIKMCKYEETNTQTTQTVIEEAPDIDAKGAADTEPARSVIAVDLGDLVETVSLLAASQERLSARVKVEEEQAATRHKDIAVELAEVTAKGANERFEKLYAEHEELRSEAKVLREEIEKAEVEARGAKWKLAEELHRQGRGPKPEVKVELEESDA